MDDLGKLMRQAKKLDREHEGVILACLTDGTWDAHGHDGEARALIVEGARTPESAMRSLVHAMA